jgi:hypothetical protein
LVYAKEDVFRKVVQWSAVVPYADVVVPGEVKSIRVRRLPLLPRIKTGQQTKHRGFGESTQLIHPQWTWDANIKA